MFTGLDGNTNAGANQIIKVNGTADGLVWADDDSADGMGTGFTVSATTDTNATTITQGDDLFFAAGTGITCETTADGTVTITNTVTNTDTDVSVSNLESRLAQIDSNYTIGNANTVDGTISGDLTVTGDLTVNGTTTTIDTANLAVEDKNIVLANIDSPTATSDDGAGLTVMSNNSYHPRIIYDGSITGHEDTGSGLGWNLYTGASTNFPYEILTWQRSTSAPGNTDAGHGIGSLWLKTDADGESPGNTKIYIRVGNDPT